MKVQWTKPSYPLTVTCIFYLTCWILDRTFSTYIVHTYAIFCCLHIWKKNYFIHEMIHLLNLNKKTNRLPQDTHWTYIEQLGFLIALILKLFIHCVVNSSGLQLRRRAALLARVFFFRQIGGGTAELAHSSAK